MSAKPEPKPYSGKFQYLDEGGRVLAEGPCRLTAGPENCTVTPASGAPVAFDLGDVDSLAPGDCQLDLKLYTGRVVRLRQFGGTFTPMSLELAAAWRDRTVRCLLLEDLEEVLRANGTAALDGGAPAKAEIRLYGSNLAVLPVQGAAFQWRLAEVDAVSFDREAYAVTLQAGAARLTIGRLAARTGDFVGSLDRTLAALRARSAELLGGLFPFLDPDRLRRLAVLMPEGRSVRLAALADLHPKIPEALVARAVDEDLKPYFDALRSRAAADGLMAGFKFVRKEVPEESEEEANENEQDFFAWFFFPLRGKNVAAWEATTGSGRATYFFRAAPPVEAAVGRITRGLGLVNFRREPVYLSDEALARQPKFRRYLIGCRKLAELRALRAAMLGRALHTSPEEWQLQVDRVVC